MTPQRWQRVRGIFEAAAVRPDAEEYARAQCGGDAELLSEVLGMLRERGISGPLDHAPAAVRASPTGSPRVFADGQLVAGRYRIAGYVGHGGMGEVYQARDLELNETVALKTLLPGIASNAAMVARFKQEIALSRKVLHPNVCGAFDLDRHPAEGSAEILFLTMPFLPGETLARKLEREGPMRVADARPLVEQMAEALDAAHRAKVIHRDFKPGNVMLVPSAEGVRAVVTDFGLARSFVTPADTTATLSARLEGTLDYMAPELLTGAVATFGSDVYALGMVVYKMVTGALPFAADTPLAGAILRSKAPVPPPRTTAPDLDPNWERAILRALERNPARRFTRASHFLQALRGEPVSNTVRLPAMTGRRWLGTAVAAAAVAGALLGWQSWMRARNRPSPEAQALYLKGIGDIEAGANFAATKALGEAVQRAPRYAPAHARLAEAWIELEMPEKASEQMLLARREDTAGLSHAERLRLEAIDLSITREFAAAVEKYEQLAKIGAGEGAEPALDLGRAYEKAGKPGKAIDSYRRAAEGPAPNPAAWLRLGLLYSRTSQPAKADEAFGQAERLYQMTSSLEGLTEVAYQRGMALTRRGDLRAAMEYLEKAGGIARTAGNVPQELNAKLQLAVDSYALGDAAAAERLAREALDMAQANQMDGVAVRGTVALGNAYQRKSDFAAAERYYQQALTLAEHNGSRQLVAYAHVSLAGLYDQVNRPAEASREAQAALTFYEPNRFNQITIQCLRVVGRSERKRGDYPAALEAFQKLLRMAEAAQDRSQQAIAHESIGGLYYVQEKYPEALEQYRESLKFSDGAEATGYAGIQCASVLWQLGRGQEAAEMLDKAEANAARFPVMHLSGLVIRADMLAGWHRYAEAAAMARRGQLENQAKNKRATADLGRILGVAEIGMGSRIQGLRDCQEALAAAEQLGDVTALLQARLAVLGALLANGKATEAVSLFEKTESALSGHPESNWRALGLLSRADGRYAARAKEALAALNRLWGDEAYRQYLARPDISEISRPLLQPISAIR